MAPLPVTLNIMVFIHVFTKSWLSFVQELLLDYTSDPFGQMWGASHAVGVQKPRGKAWPVRLWFPYWWDTRRIVNSSSVGSSFIHNWFNPCVLAAGNSVGLKTTVVVRAHSRWGRQTRRVPTWKGLWGRKGIWFVTEYLGFWRSDGEGRPLCVWGVWGQACKVIRASLASWGEEVFTLNVLRSYEKVFLLEQDDWGHLLKVGGWEPKQNSRLKLKVCHTSLHGWRYIVYPPSKNV